MKQFQWTSLWAVLQTLQLVLPASAIELDLNNDESIKRAAKVAATDMTKYYRGDQPGDVPGNLPPPYYWWEAGAMFGALIDYWFYTGDETWNNITAQGMIHQASPTDNFMPLNQSKSLGNDDQAFWGMAAMTAAERKFPNPPRDQPQWLALAQGVFNSQAIRWNEESCGGGLKWQIFRFNDGFNYKNTISNGGFFNIAARLAVYTENSTYAEWADKTWNWITDVGMVTDKYQFLDGADNLINCTEFDRIQWTYNAGIFLHGAAAMYRYVWGKRIQGIIDGLHVFFYKDTKIAYEVACEPVGNCEVDQRSFKSYLMRWMAATTQLAPFTTDYIMPRLQASAMAAARACTGGLDGNKCGLKWYQDGFDGSVGVGEQMAALEAIQGNLIKNVPIPVTNSTGGISRGDPNAGMGKNKNAPRWEDIRPITTADRVGAWILTVLFIILICWTSYWATLT